MIRNGIFFREKLIKDRTVYWPVFKQSEALAYWQQISTYTTILQVNDWVKTSADLREYFPTATRRAQQYGFLRNLPLEFERADKLIDPTEDEIRLELTKHESRSSCPSGLMKTIYKNGWNHLLDERFPTHATPCKYAYQYTKISQFAYMHQCPKQTDNS